MPILGNEEMTMMPTTEKKVLIADSDVEARSILQQGLERHGCAVMTAQTGEEALRLAALIPDLIALDVAISQPDGWEVARRLKRERSTSMIPVVFVTSRSSVMDEVVGFELGAADYIVKPFDLDRVLARFRSLLRNADPRMRAAVAEPERIAHRGLIVNVQNYAVMIDREERVFPKKEFEILVYLLSRPGRVISRGMLLQDLWGGEFKGTSRTVDVHIRKIREKLGPYGSFIETVRRVGYRCKEELRVPPGSSPAY